MEYFFINKVWSRVVDPINQWCSLFDGRTACSVILNPLLLTQEWSLLKIGSSFISTKYWQWILNPYVSITFTSLNIEPYLQDPFIIMFCRSMYQRKGPSTMSAVMCSLTHYLYFHLEQKARKCLPVWCKYTFKT